MRHFSNFIAGEWRQHSNRTMDVLDKYDRTPIAQVVASSEADVDSAVQGQAGKKSVRELGAIEEGLVADVEEEGAEAEVEAVAAVRRREPPSLPAQPPEKLVEALRKKGARFRNEIVTGVGGKQVLVEDPSGNPVELFEPILPEASLGRPA